MRLGDGRREGLLDEHVLARPEGGEPERVVGRHGSGDRHCVELGVEQEILDVAGGPNGRVPLAERVQPRLVEVADPAEVGAVELVQVANQVRPPVAEADHADPDRLGGQLAREDRRLHVVARMRKRENGVLRIRRRSRLNDQPRT